MVTREELQERYSKMEVADLLEIANDKRGYTEMANEVALNELKKRNVSNDIISEYQPVARKINELTMKNALVDLTFSQKLFFFYVVWIPKVKRYFPTNFVENGYLLKRDQSNYYSVLGLISFMATVGLTIAYGSLLALFLISFATFLGCYIFDDAYNRARQIKNIQAILESGELPWDYEMTPRLK